MGKLSILIVLVVALSACHAGFGIGDNGQGRTYVAGSALTSSMAQASIGSVVLAGD